MPDDWKDGVRDIVDEWGLELSDTIAKDTNEEFVKRISTMGVEMNLVQTEALDKLILNDIGFIAKTNKQIGESIISDVEKLLIEKGDWASAKESVLKHVEDVFSGEEKIVINNIGKTSKRVFVDTALGHAVIKDVTVQRAWSGNIQAYSDMVAKSLSQKARQMGDIEAYRMTNGIVGWRRMSSLSGRTCNICASLHGRAYYFSGVGYNGMPDDDGMMFEPHPNGYCYQVPIYDEWTGIKNRSDDMLDADLDSWKIQNEHSMSNLVRVGQMPTDTVQTDFIEKVMFDTERINFLDMSEKDENIFLDYRNSLPISEDELKAINVYTGPGYKDMNNFLMNPDDASYLAYPEWLEDTKKYINDLKSAFDSGGYDRDIVVLRGISPGRARQFIEKGSMSYKGFSSTTEDIHIAVSFANRGRSAEDFHNIIVINSKKGSRMLRVGGKEAETILDTDLNLVISKIEEIQEVKDLKYSDRLVDNVRLIYCDIN